MAGTRTYVYRDEPEGRGSGGRSSADPAAVLGAVRDDIRQTLRMAWLDPALEAVAASPVFFTAAWSAIRPNVGKSFLLLTRALRTQAVDSVRASLDPPDLRKRLEAHLSEGEIRRVEDSARAAHLAGAKAQVVVHALHRAVRRERIPGTGREEPPVRRGVPDWQRWMTLQPAPESAHPFLNEAVSRLALPGHPAALRLFARWPAALDVVWGSLRERTGTEAWNLAASRLRRIVLSGISSLPHPVDLQWTALKARGFSEDDRAGLAEVISAHDASMASQALIGAFAWAALGAPDVGVDG